MKILHRKIFILLTVSVLSTTLLTSVAGLLSATKLIKKDSHQILKLMSDSNSGKINSWFESIENTVTSLYNLAKNQLPSDTAYWSNQEYMDSYIQKMRSDTEIFALNTDSAITVYLRINSELNEFDRITILEELALKELVKKRLDEETLLKFLLPLEGFKYITVNIVRMV